MGVQNRVVLYIHCGGEELQAGQGASAQGTPGSCFLPTPLLA